MCRAQGAECRVQGAAGFDSVTPKISWLFNPKKCRLEKWALRPETQRKIQSSNLTLCTTSRNRARRYRRIVSFRAYLTECINEMVFERQVPLEIVNLLSTITYQNRGNGGMSGVALHRLVLHRLDCRVLTLPHSANGILREGAREQRGGRQQ